MAKVRAGKPAPAPELKAAIARSVAGLKSQRRPSPWTSLSILYRNVVDRFVASGHECPLPGGPDRWREAGTMDTLGHGHKFRCPECGARYIRRASED